MERRVQAERAPHGGDPPGRSDAPGRGAALAFAAAFVLLGAANLYWLWPIETEDAYLVLRYAANLAERGELVFNPGERVCALTSPLHALVVAALHPIAGDLALANKTLGLLAFCGAVAALCVALRGRWLALAIALALVALSPFEVLWAVGGLETPLLFAIVTALALVLRAEMQREQPRPGPATAAFALGGLAFVTRYDAALVVAPALVWLALRLGLARAVLPAALGALAPLAWLGFAQVYYGDVFPTSFYLKTPTPSLASAVYTLEFYLYSGLAFFHLLLGAGLAAPGGRALWRAHWRDYGWAYGALAVLFAYGLAASATHMFYSFRLFVPFLALAALPCADLATRIARSRDHAGFGRAFATATAAVIALQAVNLIAVAQPAGNVGGGRTGEFRLDGVGEISALVDDLRAPAPLIREHWSKQPASRTRPLRLSTFAAGALPYALPEAYVYTSLASYRHHCGRSETQLSLAADYITLSGYDLSRQIDSGRFDRFVLLTRSDGTSYGQIIQHVVLFNPHPLPHTLSSRIDEPCPPFGDPR